MKSGQSTLHTKHKLKMKKKKPVPSQPHLPASQPRRTNPSLHDTISHWLHGNSNPKIGCHYCWPGLIIGLGKNTHLFKLVQSMKFNSIVQQTRTSFGQIRKPASFQLYYSERAQMFLKPTPLTHPAFIPFLAQTSKSHSF